MLPGFHHATGVSIRPHRMHEVQPIAIDGPIAWFVSLSVTQPCLAKVAERSKVLFESCGSRNIVLDGSFPTARENWKMLHIYAECVKIRCSHRQTTLTTYRFAYCREPVVCAKYFQLFLLSFDVDIQGIVLSFTENAYSMMNQA